MALQSSGSISLNEIHIEAGGSNFTTASLNDTDIRGLINKASGATMSFSEWYGASAVVSLTVTKGNSGTVYGYQGGYGTSTTYGSISPSDFTVDDATLGAIYYTEFTIKGQTTRIFFVFLTGHRIKEYFTSLSETSIGTLNTSSASHVQSTSSQTNHPYTYWSWNMTSTPSNWSGTWTVSGITFAVPDPVVIGITEGTDSFPSGLYYGYRSHRNVGSIDTATTGVTVNGKTHTLYAAFRRQNASSYNPTAGSSSFWMYFTNASDGTVIPADFFTSIDLIFDGHTINLTQSSASSYTSGSGSSGRRDWRWFSSDFSSSDHDDFEQDITGTGSFDFRINL